MSLLVADACDPRQLGYPQNGDLDPVQETGASLLVADLHDDSYVIRGTGALALARILWERMVRRRRVTVELFELRRRIGPFTRFALARANTVLAPPDLFTVLAQFGVASARTARPTSGHAPSPPLHDVSRTASNAHRIVYIGVLKPSSGVADFLSCAIALADRNRSRSIEILWLGEGDLRGVLQAQPVPPNLVQHFGSVPGPGEWGPILAGCGLLVAPGLSQIPAKSLIEGMQAGLPVLGSNRSAQVRALVTHQKSGWLFDPLCADQMFAALEAALNTPPAELDKMREAARARVSAGQVESLERRFELISKIYIGSLIGQPEQV